MQLATIFSAVTAFALWALLVLAPTELKLSLLEPLFWAGAGAALDHAHHHRLLRFVRHAATTLLLLRLYVVVAVLGFAALVAVKPVFLSALVACLDFFSLALVACTDTFSSATATGHSLFCTALEACTEYLVLWTPCRPSVLDLVYAWTPLGDYFRAGDLVADLCLWAADLFEEFWWLYGDDLLEAILAFAHRAIFWTLVVSFSLLAAAVMFTIPWHGAETVFPPVVLPEHKPPPPFPRHVMYPEDPWYTERVYDNDHHAAFARVLERYRQARTHRFA